MPENPAKSTQPSTPVNSSFDDECLELAWLYAYRPEFVALLLDYVGARPGMRILDVGCGTGVLSRTLARNLDNAQVVGLDADAHLLHVAQQMLERERLTDQVELRHGNAYRIPFPDETFELVTSQALF